MSTLAVLARVLDDIAELTAAGRDAFDRDPRQRWSIERLREVVAAAGD